jgi:hypothetical protein
VEPFAEGAPEPAVEEAAETVTDSVELPSEPVVVSGDTDQPVEPEKRRGGWWQRRGLF